MNKNGGMTDVEFEKHIDTSIVPLFVPKLEDTPDKRVLVIGHDIGGKYIPIMARLIKVRRWSKR
jgi:hypothetical protein